VKPLDNRVPAGDPARNASIDVVLITSEACHLCEMAKESLTELSVEYPMQIRTVDILDPEGLRLIRDSRAPFPPVLFVNGALHGYGRVSSRRLRRQLDDVMAGV
jgi:hypothetical protein